jgi:ornithine carbamoyltransferase
VGAAMIDGDRAALLVVDVQNDFCPGGTLPVPNGDAVVDALNHYAGEAAAQGVAIYASRDWHPAATTHFKAYGGPWPRHCVQDTDGARFHPSLHLPASTIVVTKGVDPNAHGYSAFEGRTPDGTPFLTDLKERGIRRLYVGGLATDYCVKQSALDALSAGLQVTVLEDAIAGVNHDDSDRALDDMRAKGADVVARRTLSAALRSRDLRSIRDLSAAELRFLIALAADIKARPRLYDRVLAGRSVAMLFEKPSLRTRVSFAVASQQLGGHAIYLTPQEVGLGRREATADIARTLSQMVDAIVIRTFSPSTIDELADAASIPVINALSDESHPCQALGDYLTMREVKGALKGLRLAFVGDGNNVANSLIFGAALLGVRMTIASPAGYEPRPDALTWARRHALEPGIACRVTDRPEEAVRDADVVYTDTWISMGQEAEQDVRRRAFAGFRVTPDLMRAARPDAVFMHCLPAHRGEEVDDGVIDSPQSIVFRQAANRVHTEKALLVALLGAENPF